MFFWLAKSCWVGLAVLAVWLVLSLLFLWPVPNLNTFCVWHLDAYPLSKDDKKHICSEKLKKHIWFANLFFFFLISFWSSEVPFLEIWCHFYFFIYYYGLLFLFVNLDSIPLFTRGEMIKFTWPTWLSCIQEIATWI